MLPVIHVLANSLSLFPYVLNRPNDLQFSGEIGGSGVDIGLQGSTK